MIFQKDSARHFTSPQDFMHFASMALTGVTTAVIHPGDQLISRSLGEKIMLAVTGVNQCRHCSFLHSQLSLEQGISADEISALLAGDFSNIHPDEAPAVMYAQHWADSRSKVSTQAKAEITDFYGAAKTRQIEAYIRTVYFGNMCCNTRDAWTEASREERRSVSFLMTCILAFIPAIFVRLAGRFKAGSDS